MRIVAHILSWMKSGTAQVPQIIGKISVLPLAAVIFFTVSGGPYGIEPLIGYAGGTEQHDAGGRRIL